MYEQDRIDNDYFLYFTVTVFTGLPSNNDDSNNAQLEIESRLVHTHKGMMHCKQVAHIYSYLHTFWSHTYCRQYEWRVSSIFHAQPLCITHAFYFFMAFNSFLFFSFLYIFFILPHMYALYKFRSFHHFALLRRFITSLIQCCLPLSLNRLLDDLTLPG